MADRNEEKSPALSLASIWSEGRVWFREFIPRDTAWGREDLLEPVPDSHREQWAVRVTGRTYVDERNHKAGELVPVHNAEAVQRLVQDGKAISAVAVPWYDRLIPAGLTLPNQGTIDRSKYLRNLRQPFAKAAIICVAAILVVVFYPKPDIFFLALIAGTMFGLFPLIEVIGLALERVDRLSVEELNRRRVNHFFFFSWIRTLRGGALIWAAAALALVLLGQIAVGLIPSIDAAALVKNDVLQNGEWWRLLTTGLMHGSLMHLLFNGAALFSFGKLIRALVNPAALAIVFLVTVITGSLASLYFSSAAASVGASGGILGCLGFLLVVVQRFKAVLPHSLRTSLIQSTIVVSIFGALGAGFIDNAAHAGGFFGGVGIGLLFWKSLRLAGPASTTVRALGAISAVVLVAGLAKVALELIKIAP